MLKVSNPLNNRQIDMYGYMGKIAWVDLTAGKVKSVGVNRAWAKRFMGGKGFGASILYDGAPTIAPLDEKSRLIFAAGPLTGTKVPTANKYGVFF